MRKENGFKKEARETSPTPSPSLFVLITGRNLTRNYIYDNTFENCYQIQIYNSFFVLQMLQIK